MTLLAACLTLLLAALAGLYALWASGRFWPCDSEAELARRVVRIDRAERMPHRSFLATVAVFLAVAAFWPWLLLFPPLTGRWAFVFPWAAIVFVVVFGFRGVSPYLGRAEFSPSSDSPFMRRDRRYYGPVALFAAAGFAVLVWGYYA